MDFRFVAAPAVALSLLAGAAAAGAPSSPAGAAQALYAWVFHPKSDAGKLRGARAYLTPRFYADLARIDEVETLTKKEVLDANPFIDAQIEADSFTVGTPRVRGGTALVPVKITYKRFPQGHMLTMVEKRTASGWRIDDILDHTGSSTDALIRRNVAMTMKYYRANR